MPHAVNGTPLTIGSATDATSLSGAPSSRALNAAVTSFGKKPADLEIAEAYDASGSIDLTILGLRVAGVDPSKLRPVVIDAMLATTAPGVTSSDVNLSGTPATAVSYGDGGPTEYALIHGDSVFLIETADATLAAKAVAAMAAPSPSPSAG